jgi:hypothetical protein
MRKKGGGRFGQRSSIMRKKTGEEEEENSIKYSERKIGGKDARIWGE